MLCVYGMSIRLTTEAYKLRCCALALSLSEMAMICVWRVDVYGPGDTTDEPMISPGLCRRSSVSK